MTKHFDRDDRLFDDKLKCSKIKAVVDWDNHLVQILVPRRHVPSMTGAVNLAQRMDPDVQTIHFVDEESRKKTTVYHKWGSFMDTDGDIQNGVRGFHRERRMEDE